MDLNDASAVLAEKVCLEHVSAKKPKATPISRYRNYSRVKKTDHFPSLCHPQGVTEFGRECLPWLLLPSDQKDRALWSQPVNRESPRRYGPYLKRPEKAQVGV